MSPSGLDAPPVTHASANADVMLAVWAGMALAAAGVAVWLAWRNRDALPVAACVGALICTLNEPIYDILAKLTYAESPHVAYSAFGRDIPWTLVVGYVPWVGLMPYVLSRMIAAGATRARLVQMAAGLTASVVLIEIVNAAWLHAWTYYGQSAWRGVLGGGVIQMAAMPLLCALLYCLLGERLAGARRAALGIVLPPMTLPMVFASTTWPLYVSNHADVSAGAAWLAAAASVGLCVLTIVAVISLAGRWQTGDLAPRRAPAAGTAPAPVDPPVAVPAG